MNKIIIKNIFLISIFSLLSMGILSAQNFRGIKFGMTMKQVQEREPKSFGVIPVRANTLSYKIPNPDESIYSSYSVLNIDYVFSDVVDSIVRIFLTYKDIDTKFYGNELKYLDSICLWNTSHGNILWWISKDSSYEIALNYLYKCKLVY
jgi:hypothetical protein